MITGGISGKLGIWYEESFVIYQMLRLLVGQLTSIRWEYTTEQGIDCWTTESTGTVAIQCKTNANGTWGMGRICDPSPSGRSIASDAFIFLRLNSSNRFLFVSNAGVPTLEFLREIAKSAPIDVATLSKENRKAYDTLVGNWKAVDDSLNPAQVRDLLLRIGIETISTSAIDSQNVVISKQLCGHNDERMIDTLRVLARRSLTAPIHPESITAELAEKGIRVLGHAHDPLTHERLEALALRFEDRLNPARQVPLIDRHSLKAEVAKWVAAKKSRSTLLIHGAAGSGKSEIIQSAISLLRELKIPTLCLTPDANNDDIGLGPCPIEALALHSADRIPVLIIDQLDQVLNAGATAQKMLVNVSMWIRQAHNLGAMVMVGCRSIDAKHETQLNFLFKSGEHESILVGDLDDAQVDAVLKSEGIDPATLSMKLRRVINRPLHLSLLVILARERIPLNAIVGPVSLVDKWWNHIREPLGDRCDKLMDALAESMWRDGVFIVPIDGWDVDVVNHLIRAKVLVREQRANGHYLRVSHQLFIDVRIAQQWRKSRSGPELLVMIGDRATQSLHQVRRMTLSTPLIAAGPRGPEILRQVMDSREVRALIKRGILMGLAQIDAPSVGVVRLVVDLLNDSQTEVSARNIILWGRPHWMDSVQSWLNDRFSRVPMDRQGLVDLVMSVKKTWGDGVARLMRQWNAIDPSVQAIFMQRLWQDPHEDSDDLFRLRLEWMSSQDRDTHLDWKGLIRSQPSRATELMLSLIKQEPLAELLSMNPPHWLHGFPFCPLPDAFMLASPPLVRGFLAWWGGVSCELWSIHTASLNLPDCALKVAVDDIIGTCIANDLSHGRMRWIDLIDQLPASLRELDAWLLLSIGAKLRAISEAPDFAQQAADSAARWIMSNAEWAHIHVSTHGRPQRLDLGGRFLAAIGKCCSQETVGILEAYCMSYQDPWSMDDERRRISESEKFWHIRSNSRGFTCFRLMSSIPQERLSMRAITHLAALTDKFRTDHDYYFKEHSDTFGWVGSAIPDEVALRWSSAEWMRHLTLVPKARESWWRPQKVPGEIRVYDLSQLSHQLGHLVSNFPNRMLPVVAAMSAATPSLAKSEALRGLQSTSRPDRAPADWIPAPDQDVVAVASQRHFLADPACAQSFFSLVERRPKAEWPPSVVAALLEAAFSPSDEAPYVPKKRKHDLMSYRINNPNCTAMTALGQLSWHSDAVRDELLARGPFLLIHSNFGRRAALARAMSACLNDHLDRAADILLACCQERVIATEWDVHELLRWLALTPRDTGKFGSAARSILLSFADDESESIAEIGGRTAMALHASERFSRSELLSVVNRSTAARKAAADQLASCLGDHAEEWNGCRSLAVEFANDKEPIVGDAIMSAFRNANCESLLRDRAFMMGITDSRAARRNAEYLMSACDSHNMLMHLHEVVLRTAERLAVNPADASDQGFAHSNMSEVISRLARLVEEDENRGVSDIRTRALDAWDKLIESEAPFALDLLRDRIDSE